MVNRDRIVYLELVIRVPYFDNNKKINEGDLKTFLGTFI